MVCCIIFVWPGGRRSPVRLIAQVPWFIYQNQLEPSGGIYHWHKRNRLLWLHVNWKILGGFRKMQEKLEKLFFPFYKELGNICTNFQISKKTCNFFVSTFKNNNGELRLINILAIVIWGFKELVFFLLLKVHIVWEGNKI